MSESGRRGFLIPVRVVTAAAKEGIRLEELQDMLQRSARFTHAEGNRRYHDYLFMVEGKRLLKFSKITEAAPHTAPVEDVVDDVVEDVVDHEEVHYKCETCKDVHRVQVFDECARCHGEGCNKCDEGLVPSSIPCPACTRQKTVFKRRI